jgi:hypothetical protein
LKLKQEAAVPVGDREPTGNQAGGCVAVETVRTGTVDWLQAPVEAMPAI